MSAEQEQVPEQTVEALKQAVAIMARLRGPDGCPWDREQTFDSIKKHTLEETYEVFDAIERRAWPDLKDELGDLLLQVLFYAQMAEDAGYFSIGDVAAGLNAKLIRRHPHIFADAVASTPAAVLRNWEQIKKEEKAAARRDSVLDSIPRSMAAMLEPTTSFAGMFERASGQAPYQLPARWLAAKVRLDPATVLDFATTNDIVGGNSGSPAIARDGSVIGAAFDGNIHSLGGSYGYDPALNRSVIVSTRRNRCRIVRGLRRDRAARRAERAVAARPVTAWWQRRAPATTGAGQAAGEEPRQLSPAHVAAGGGQVDGQRAPRLVEQDLAGQPAGPRRVRGEIEQVLLLLRRARQLREVRRRDDDMAGRNTHLPLARPLQRLPIGLRHLQQPLTRRRLDFGDAAAVGRDEAHRDRHAGLKPHASCRAAASRIRPMPASISAPVV